MASAYDFWLSAPYCDQKDQIVNGFEQKAKDSIRRELMDDDIFASEAALHCSSSINSLYYISKAARGNHNTALAMEIHQDIDIGDKSDDEKYIESATQGNHDTALAAKIKAALVEQIVEFRWAGIAKAMSESDREEYEDAA